MTSMMTAPGSSRVKTEAAEEQAIKVAGVIMDRLMERGGTELSQIDFPPLPPHTHSPPPPQGGKWGGKSE